MEHVFLLKEAGRNHIRSCSNHRDNNNDIMYRVEKGSERTEKGKLQSQWDNAGVRGVV